MTATILEDLSNAFTGIIHEREGATLYRTAGGDARLDNADGSYTIYRSWELEDEGYWQTQDFDQDGKEAGWGDQEGPYSTLQEATEAAHRQAQKDFETL